MNKITENKNLMYGLGFTAIAVILLIIVLIINIGDDTNEKTNVAGNSGPTASTYQPASQNVSQGDMNETIEAAISLREVKFSDTMEEIKAREDSLPDTLPDPTILNGTDDFTYLIYASNPENPIKYNGYAVTGDPNSGLYYAFRGQSLEEVRIQYGALSKDDTNGLVNSIKGQYGESTYYRALTNSEAYWWRSADYLLMLNVDSAGVTLYYRRNDN